MTQARLHRVVGAMPSNPDPYALYVVRVGVGAKLYATDMLGSAKLVTSIEHPTLVDASRPVAYAGYPGRIVRMDYTTYPPTKTQSSTSNLQQDWANRSTLTYA